MWTEPRAPLEAGFSVTAVKVPGKAGRSAVGLVYCAMNGIITSPFITPSK